MTNAELKAFARIFWRKIEEPISITVMVTVMVSWLPLILNFFVKSFYEMSKDDRIMMSLLAGIGSFVISLLIGMAIIKISEMIEEASKEDKEHVAREAANSARQYNRLTNTLHVDTVQIVPAQVAERDRPRDKEFKFIKSKTKLDERTFDGPEEVVETPKVASRRLEEVE